MDIFWVLFIVAAIVGWRLIQKDNKTISAILKRQSLQRAGSMKTVMASYPQLSFRHKEADILVSASHGDSGPFTYAQFYTTVFPDSCSFKITSRSMPTLVMETRLELRKVELDQPEFDNKFVIRTKKEEFIRSLLTQNIQKQLLELDAGRGLEVRFLSDASSDAKDSVERHRFDISIERLLTDYHDYERLIEAAILLYEQMKTLTTA